MKFSVKSTENAETVHSASATAVKVDVMIVTKDRLQLKALSDYELKEHVGERGAVTWLYGQRGQSHVVLAGVGDVAKLNPEQIRIAAGCVSRAVKKEDVDQVTIHFNGLQEGAGLLLDEAEAAHAWVEGWLLGSYSFDKYKSTKRDSREQEIVLLLEPVEETVEAVRLAEIRAQGTMLARDLGNEPPNILRPSTVVERVLALMRDENVKVRVYHGVELQERQMNGLLAVGRGSSHPPAMVEMRYCTDPSRPLIALVGKGITFDTGGISLKTARDLSDMRIDMGGAAAVIGAMMIISRSGIAANVVGLTALAENVPDGGSMLPGELIRYPNGVSVQVKNTDAEGRLVLADALIHASTLGATHIVDIATLTGACVSALGVRMAGVWGTEGMAERLQLLGNSNGEKAWPMPLEAEYEELLKSQYADIANITNVSYGGAITAALFLRRFVDPSAAWAHLDIAGPMDSSKTHGYITEGATGYGARLLADYVQWQSSN